MSQNWNMERLKKIAGIPLTESVDDDDEDEDLSPAERELAAKADKDLAKKGIKVGKVDPDKDMHALAQHRKAKETKKEADEDSAEEAEKKAAAEESKKSKEAEPKAEPEPKKEEPKKEEAATEAKRRGRAPNENSKAQRGLAWIKANPTAKRGEFLKWAAANTEMGTHYASAFFAKHNPKSGRQKQIDECWILVHPQLNSFLLTENREMNQYQWIDPSSSFDPIVFDTEDAANKVATYMAEWKNQHAIVEKINLAD